MRIDSEQVASEAIQDQHQHDDAGVQVSPQQAQPGLHSHQIQVGGGGDRRREEEMFQQGHSLIGGKRRRSRSKRRK